jgi:hypothetical protein
MWKTARVIAVPKTEKSKLHTVQCYRGIILPLIPGKCLETLVTGRLNVFLVHRTNLTTTIRLYGW